MKNTDVVDLFGDGGDLLGDGGNLLSDDGDLLGDGGNLLGDGGNGRATRDWKSESVTDQRTNLPTYQLTWVGARDTCVSKKIMKRHEIGGKSITFVKKYKFSEKV